MEILEEKKGTITVFSLKGRLDSTSSKDLESKLHAAIEEGNTQIIIDLADLDYISSAGIRILVQCHKEIGNKKGQVFLCSLPPAIENVFYITGFLPYFTIHDTQAHAIEAMRQTGTKG